MTTGAAEVNWQELQHAYGRAHDVPQLLAALSRARGGRLRKEMERLWERVLHQGSIYSASPPAVQALIPLAAQATGADRRLYYELLAEFASSARQAVRDQQAGSGCSPHDGEYGQAILSHLMAARDTFAADLASDDGAVRRLAANLLCCCKDAGSEAAALIRTRFESEPDPDTRRELLHALMRVSHRVEDWPGVLAAALDRETDPALRFTLRRAQVRHFRNAVDEEAVRELTALFVKECADAPGADAQGFFQALASLGPEREPAALLATLQSCVDRPVLRAVAVRSLRLAFHDERAGWDTQSTRLLSDDQPGGGGMDKLPGEAAVLRGIVKVLLLAMLWKIFPFLLRRRLRKSQTESNRRRYRVEYYGVTGSKPEIPERLTASQQRTLAALAGKPELWVDQTNLWALFDLPDTAAGLRDFLARRG